MQEKHRNTRRLDIVGAGRVGRTLGRLWQQHGVFEIGIVANRSRESAREAVAFLGAGREGHAGEIGDVDVLMLATPDGALAGCAAQLAAGATGANIRPGAVVFHCSGSIASDVLAPLRRRGAAIASLHPVKSFADAAHAIESFPGTFCAVEGDPAAVELLTEAVGAIGGRVFAIDPAAKAIYHAGSVFASNYLIATVAAGVDCLVRAGVERETAVEVLRPIAHGALDNLFRLGPVDALTGPIARGETQVVETQIAALSEWDTAISAAYAALGVLATRLAKQQGRAGEEALRQITQALARATPPER